MNLPVIVDSNWKIPIDKICDKTLFTYPNSYAKYSCLKIKTIFNFVKYPYSIRVCNNGEFSPSGNLPCLLSNGKIIVGNDIIAHIAIEGFDIDQHLSIENQANSRAFVALLESTLEFVLVIYN
jgi:hypothetical protein